jgi:hypothetical protein
MPVDLSQPRAYTPALIWQTTVGACCNSIPSRCGGVLSPIVSSCTCRAATRAVSGKGTTPPGRPSSAPTAGPATTHGYPGQDLHPYPAGVTRRAHKRPVRRSRRRVDALQPPRAELQRPGRPDPQPAHQRGAHRSMGGSPARARCPSAAQPRSHSSEDAGRAHRRRTCARSPRQRDRDGRSVCLRVARRARPVPLDAADPGRRSDPRGMFELKTDWMDGIQFYLRRSPPLAHGHIACVDSPWKVSGILQAQFWARDSPRATATDERLTSKRRYRRDGDRDPVERV